MSAKQLFHRLREALVVDCLAVPAALALHERDALALDGMRQDDGRLTLDGLCLLEGVMERVYIVTVNFDRVPAERAELCVHIAETGPHTERSYSDTPSPIRAAACVAVMLP